MRFSLFHSPISDGPAPAEDSPIVTYFRARESEHEGEPFTETMRLYEESLRGDHDLGIAWCYMGRLIWGRTGDPVRCCIT